MARTTCGPKKGIIFIGTPPRSSFWSMTQACLNGTPGTLTRRSVVDLDMVYRGSASSFNALSIKSGYAALCLEPESSRSFVEPTPSSSELDVVDAPQQPHEMSYPMVFHSIFRCFLFPISYSYWYRHATPAPGMIMGKSPLFQFETWTSSYSHDRHSSGSLRSPPPQERQVL